MIGYIARDESTEAGGRIENGQELIAESVVDAVGKRVGRQVCERHKKAPFKEENTCRGKCKGAGAIHEDAKIRPDRATRFWR